MIPVTCPCGKKLTFTPEFAGKRVKCQACGQPVQVPGGTKRAVVQTCRKHPEARATAKCESCGAAICTDCRAALGYYCSEKCKATHVRVVEPALAPEERKAVGADRKIVKSVRLGLLGMALILAGCLGIWIIKKVTYTGGKTAWEVDLAGEFATDLFADGDTLCLVTGSGKVLKFDPESGEKKGEFSAGADDVWRLARADDLVVFGGESGIYGVRISDGTVAWRNEEFNAGSFSWIRRGEAVVDGGRIFVRAREEEKASVAALDVRTGKRIWETPLEKSNWVQDLRAGAGRVCVYLGRGFGGDKGEIVLLDGSAGAMLWKREMPAGSGTWPVLTEKGVLLLANDGLKLLAYGDGKPVWEIPFEVEEFEHQGANLWVEKGRVLVHFKARLMCIELATGQPKWQTVAPPYLYSFAVTERGVVVAGYAEESLKDIAAKLIRGLHEHA